MTHLHELRRTRLLALLAAWVLMLPVLVCLAQAYSDFRLDTVSLAAFLAIFALILLGFLWRRKWVWLILLAEWCCFPYGWTALQFYGFVPGAGNAPLTETIKWDFDPVDVYCNGVLVGRTPIEIDPDEIVKSIPPANPPSQEMIEVPGWRCRSFGRTETLFGFAPWKTWEYYWWSFDCAGHSGLFCARDDARIESATGPMFPSIQAHADALVHALQHAGYHADPAWVKRTGANLTPLFSFLNDMAYRDLLIKPALDQAVSEEFGIRESMSQDEVSACWADILNHVEEKRAFRIPSPEWYAINLLGDRLLPFLERSYMEERGRRNPPSRFHHGLRPVYLSPEGVAVRFLPVFYAVGRLLPPELKDRITYDAGAFGTPFEVLRQAYMSLPYNRHRIAPLARHYDLGPPIFDNLISDWGMASQLPLIHPIQVVSFRSFTPEDARLLVQSVPSMPIETVLFWGGIGRDMSLLGRLRYLTVLRAPSLVSEFQIPVGCLAPSARNDSEPSQGRLGLVRGRSVPLSALSEDERIRIDRITRDRIVALFAAVAEFPNSALDRPLLACFDEARSYPTLPSETRELIQALIMCGTPAVCEVLGRWWGDNTPVSITGETVEQTSPRALITDAIATLPRMAEPLACWVPYLAALDDPQLMTRAVDALVSIHTPEAWAVLEKWSAGGPLEVVDAGRTQGFRAAARRAIETERSEIEKIAALIAGTLQPDELISQ